MDTSLDPCMLEESRYLRKSDHSLRQQLLNESLAVAAMTSFPWHMVIPSVAVAGHWYLALGPAEPVNDAFEMLRNVTGISLIGQRADTQSCSHELETDAESGCHPEIRYDDSWLWMVKHITCIHLLWVKSCLVT